MAPLYLGVKAALAKSFARIHHVNLVNLGIMPLTFTNASDYDTLEQGDELEIAGIHAALKAGEQLTAKNLTRDVSFQLTYDFSKRQMEIILSGGLLNYIKKGG
jgi:aconitate hydratase